MKAIGYVRVSTDRQAELGVSLEAQEAKIRAMASLQGAQLFEVIVDGGESAKNLNRPGLQRLLALVDSGKVEAVIMPNSTGSRGPSKTSAVCWSYSRSAASR
jgi:DNA invertase Pin-like site-specific DNA recombinase